MTTNELVRRAREEFSKPIPSEYIALIGLGKETRIPGEHPIFKNSDEVTALEEIADIRKYPDFLQRFRHVLLGRDFIDLGCGGSYSCPLQVRDFAKKEGARRYIGVDLDMVGGEDSSSTTKDGFDTIFLWETEILQFLSSIPDNHPTGKLLWFCGLESTSCSRCFADEKSREYKIHIRPRQDYFSALYHEIGRITRPGDGIFLSYLIYTDNLCHGRNLSPEKLKELGFKLQNRIFVRG